MYYFYVVYQAKNGCGKKFVEELNASGTATAVRNEDGCIKYDYYFSEANPDEILLVEIWESHEKQQIHLTQPHIATLLQIKEKYIESSKMGENFPM